MTQHEYLEAFMLMCFSISWYWSIARMLKVRAAIGKSAFFVLLICAGYLFGITSKLAAWHATGTFSPLIWLYIWNLGVTAIDLALVLHFSGWFQRTRAEPKVLVQDPGRETLIENSG